MAKTLVIALSTALGATLCATATARADCNCWRYVRPSGQLAKTSLSEVTTPTRKVAWATGSRAGKPVLLSWTGSGWREMPLGVPQNAVLEGIDAADATHAWLVARQPNGTPLALQWNGRKWTKATVARPGPSFPRAIDDHWMVGSSSGFAGSSATIWRWNGAKWQTQPFNGGPDSELVAVDGDWAVGSQRSGQLIATRDGTRWNQVEAPKIAGSVLTDVAVTCLRSIWAVGSRRTTIGGTTTERTLVQHWDGKDWKVMPSLGAGKITSVAYDGDGGVWVAGRTGQGRALLAHWDGKAWERSAAPTPASKAESAVLGLAHQIDSSYLWAVGVSHGRSMTWTNAPRPR